MKPIRLVFRRIARWISRWLYRHGILAGQVYDTRYSIRATTIILRNGIIEKALAAPGMMEGPPNDWLRARNSARNYNIDEKRKRWIVEAIWFGRR